MTYSTFSYPVAAIILLSSILSLTGCTESGVEPDEHEEPVGIVISVDGTELLRQIGDTARSLGSLHIDSTSALFEVSFLDDHGTTFTPESDEGFSLSVHIADTTITRLAEPVTPGSWSFRLTGQSVGVTSLQVSLDHGGHADFVSGDISIEVTE